MLHKLAAIKIVREIELKVAALGFDYNDPDGGSGKPEEKIYKQEIIDIAVREGMAWRLTVCWFKAIVAVALFLIHSFM